MTMDELSGGSRIFHIQTLFFTDGENLEDITAAIEGSFLIVASKWDDPAPTWYNLNKIECMRGVREIRNMTQYRDKIYYSEYI